MGGLFAALGTSTRALAVNEAGLAVAGHNIANVNTPGYTRQRQVREAAAALPTSTGTIGRGVEQTTIDRIRDEFLEQRLVQESANKGRSEIRANVLCQIENIFNEQGSKGLQFQLSAFFDSLDGLAAASTPNAAVERTSVVAGADSLVESFHLLDAQMRDLQRSADRTLEALLPQINSTVARIAELSEEIRGVEATAPANDLRDSQQKALLELSQLVDVSTFEDARGGLVVLLEGGLPLIDGDTTYQLTSTTAAVVNPFDATFDDVSLVGNGVSFNVTNSITGGELGGLLYGRDTATADAIRELDALATTLVEAMNAQHRVGRGLRDDTARDFFEPLAQLADAAARIELSADIVATPDHIAAGQAPGPASSADNRNALLLSELRGTAIASYQKDDVLGIPTGSTRVFILSLATMVGNHGQRALVADQARDQQNSIFAQVETQRDSVSAVSLDEKVTDLIRLQSAYQANARVISTINALLGEMLNIL